MAFSTARVAFAPLPLASIVREVTRPFPLARVTGRVRVRAPTRCRAPWALANPRPPPRAPRRGLASGLG